MWLLICLVAVATSDDFWPIATVGAGNALLIATDDADTDGSVERPLAYQSGGLTGKSHRSFVRKPVEVTDPADLRNGFRLRYRPRGPPVDGWDKRGIKFSCSWTTAAGPSIAVVPLPVPATPHSTSLKTRTPAGFSRSRSGANRKLHVLGEQGRHVDDSPPVDVVPVDSIALLGTLNLLTLAVLHDLTKKGT
jgi:hypothetical protein